MNINIFNYIDMDKLEAIKRTLKNGDNKVIYENDKMKITLKKRGKKIYTFIDEFKNNRNINKILQNIINMI